MSIGVKSKKASKNRRNGKWRKKISENDGKMAARKENRAGIRRARRAAPHGS